MDFRIGAPVSDRDGDKVGEVKHVIVDPRTGEITEIVLGQSGLLGRDVLVPIGAVMDATHDRVRLALAKDKIDDLKDFVVTHYIAPPPGADWSTGGLYPQAGFPVGAATGIQSIGYAPIVEEELQIPEGDLDIQPGTEVWATDGKVGQVDEVLYDDQTNRVRGFVVKEGLIFHHDVEVPIVRVAAMSSDRITLRLTKRELEGNGDTSA